MTDSAIFPPDVSNTIWWSNLQTTPIAICRPSPAELIRDVVSIQLKAQSPPFSTPIPVIKWFQQPPNRFYAVVTVPPHLQPFLGLEGS